MSERVPEPSLQFEKSRGDEFCDESLDEVPAVAWGGVARGRNPKSSRFGQKAVAGLGMFSRAGGCWPSGETELKFVLRGIRGSEDLMDRLMARVSWALRSEMLWLLLSLLLLGPWVGSFSSFSRSYLSDKNILFHRPVL